MAWAGGFQKSWTVQELPELKKYLESLQFTSWRPKFIVLHNTGAPSLKRWLETPELQRIKNLEHYYKNQKGWPAGPHFFVSPTRIFEGTPCNLQGRHSPSWNHLSLGVEMAGDFENEAFDENVWRNTCYLLAVLHNMLGLQPDDYVKGVRGLHFHKEDDKTTHKHCPGKNVSKNHVVLEIKERMTDLLTGGDMADHNAAEDETASKPDQPQVKPPLVPVPMPDAGNYDPMATKAVPADARQAFPSVLGSNILRQGQSGSLVSMLQQVLISYGYKLKGTGYFGGATESAVRDFQRKAKIASDGEVGAMTARAMAEGLVEALETREVAFPGGEVPIKAADPQQPLWLTEALSWLTTKEVPGKEDNPKILGWAKDVGGMVEKAYKDDSIPWCALFANMVLAKVGLPGTSSLWALDFHSTKALVTLPGPAVGAFMPMRRKGGGHIAIVVGQDQHGNIMCVGGNQSDEVNIKPFPRARAESYRWPKGVTLPTAIGFDALPLVNSNGKVSTNEA